MHSIIDISHNTLFITHSIVCKIKSIVKAASNKGGFVIQMPVNVQK